MILKRILMAVFAVILALGATSQVKAAEVSAKTSTSSDRPEVKIERKSDASATRVINLNTASKAELEALDGIGPIRAQKIIDHRPYKNVDDLIRADIPKVTISHLSGKVSATAPAPKTVKVEKKTTLSEPAGAEIKVDKKPKVSVNRVPRGVKVNINTATKAELEALPEIGPIKAQAIIDNRPFKNTEDIMRVPGIKEGTFNEIKSDISVR